ncbi:Ger(x)C family spore germination protein [Bacillus sinesaloumensis]|uniref:Ger(x)C family spore germination protein n=1 Tax=Litchfieldia sinesaloumensis TaxID=1926280 RepID=UPI000988718E|nr:Ger(x)C family spore germination protein [Bacillus sinesaloumensis]
MKKLRLLLILVVTMNVLTGCWDRLEVNDIAVVTAIGLDLIKDDKIRLSLQVAIPSALGPTGASGTGSSDGKSTYIISETGETLSEAYRNLQLKISRRIFFSQSRVLLIGEEMAKKGVSNIIDFHSRYHEPRINSFVMLTKGEAAEFIKTMPKLESVSAEETKELIKLSAGLTVYVRDFLSMLLMDGMEPFAPELTLTPLEVGDKNGKEEGQAVNGTAVFKDDKLVGWLDKSTTRGLLWIRNEMEKGVITVKVPEEDGDGNISIDIVQTEVKINPQMKNGKLAITINVNANMNVMENDSTLNLDDSKILEDLQSKVESEISDRIQSVIDIVQKEYQSDIFGFGQAIYKKYPKQWNSIYRENWEEEFSQLTVDIKPTVSIKRIGLSKQSNEI